MILREIDRQRLLQIFSTSKQPIEVWAYGSRVDGTAHSGSDLDLVVRGRDRQPLLQDNYMDLMEKIQESHIPILVEFRDWNRLPLSFHRKIEQQHEVLYSSY